MTVYRVEMRESEGEWQTVGTWDDAGAAGRSSMAWKFEHLGTSEVHFLVRSGVDDNLTETEWRDFLTGMDEWGNRPRLLRAACR